MATRVSPLSPLSSPNHHRRHWKAQCFGWTLTEIAAYYIFLCPSHAYFFLCSLYPWPPLLFFIFYCSYPSITSLTTLFSLSLSRSFLCFYHIRDYRKISRFVINALWVFIQIHIFFFFFFLGDHNEYINLINLYILCVYLRIFNFRVNA